MTNFVGNHIDHVQQDKLQLYHDFLSATLRLKEALQNEETAMIERLLMDRAGLAAQVDRLDQLIRRHEQTENHQDLANRNRQANNHDDMAKLLRLIVAANDDCDALAADKAANLKKELLMIHQKKAGLHSYVAQPQQRPVFLNVKF